MTSRLGAGGRERFRRESLPPSRYEETGTTISSGKRGSNPPSRHLWVGNLPQGVSENDVTYHFSRYGELESVAFQPGRSYAFLNFKEPEDAIAALESLQGFPLAGNPLRVEFAKADKSSAPSRGEDYLKRRDEQCSASRGSPLSQRNSRARNASPDTFHLDKSKMSGRSVEPSEVLWIGFPALLKVDEMILRRAFSPFGEIEKITAFPGRSYAFVRFSSVTSACRAKETLQGKLFGNPRVHICFARSEAGASGGGRTPLSPHLKSNGRAGASENFRQDRSYGSFAADPSGRSHLIPDLDPGDSGVFGFHRKSSLYPGGDDTFDNWRFGEELGPPPDMYECHGSPIREMGDEFRAQNFPHKSPLYEEPWEMPDDPYHFREAKKLKTSYHPSDRELPEYPFSDPETEKRPFARPFSDFSPSATFDKNFEPGCYGYKPFPDGTIDKPPRRGERSDLRTVPYDDLQASSGSLRANSGNQRRYTPEPDQASLKLWKWEGTIAKGGSPVCRARCFPVGKVMDFMLPKFLDCTARTGLDMLAKHYYQAASAWVVFFVPDDADIEYYNEFMHYLEEKQRAAVAKLDDRTTLFLVPPSEFSEKVLKVPGNLSISGVVLRLENPGSNSGPPHHPSERRDTSLQSMRGDASFLKPSTTSEHFHSLTSFGDSGRLGGEHSSLGNVASPPASGFSGSTHSLGRIPDSFHENRHDYSPHHRNPSPDWPPHHSQNSMSGNINLRSLATRDVADSVFRERHQIMSRRVHENISPDYAAPISNNPLSGNSMSSLLENKLSGLSSMPIAGLQPQQLAQLASSLLGQQRQSGSHLNVPLGDYSKTSTPNQPDSLLRPVQTYGLQNNQSSFEIPSSLVSQPEPLPHQQTINGTSSSPLRREIRPEVQGNPSMHGTSTQEETDADPQKRLQATLQLAAALLQQIQQGKGT